MGKTSLAEISDALGLTIKQEVFDRVPLLAALLLRYLQTPQEYRTALNLLEPVPETLLFTSGPYRQIWADILYGAGELEPLQRLASSYEAQFDLDHAAPFWIKTALGLLTQGRHSEACTTLERIEPHLEGEKLGRCLALLGRARFKLGQPWQDAFVRALSLLSGLELARTLIDQGYCFAQSGLHQEARACWQRALPLVRHRASTTAVIRYNLGISAQRELLPEAEEHFLALEQLTRAPSLRFRRAQALNGLALHRRSLGEWSRALAAYGEALLVAQTPLERRVAHNGLARVHYLSGQPAKALEVLEAALLEPELDRSPLEVTRALVLLVLNDPHGAEAALRAAEDTHADAVRWLAALARAELHRRQNQSEAALACLEGLPVHGLQAREEAPKHSALVQLLREHGLPAPEPLAYTPRIVVRVQARGALRVFVNARGVNIGAVSRLGELVVFLLEYGGSASTEVIAEALYPDAARAQARKSIWGLVKLLRRALGWPESVLALRGAYQLDPGVTWEYDVAEARTRGDFQGEFLSGVYSDWALEVGRSLQGKQRRRLTDLEMN